MTKYIVDIGLEVHIELSTRSKMFCSCAVVDNTTAAPNTAVCPVCCGMPGTLPVINRNAVELAIKAALALECQIAHTSIFARKNYFYPDLPKGYQISQYEKPLAEHGRLLIHTSKGEKLIRVHRAHLEEDTGKLTHIENEDTTFSLVNLNRAGVPLLEIVSEPDMHSVEEAVAYSRELRLLLRTIDVTSGDMEKGTMRFEANISMRPEGSDELGTRVEVKNLNSFKAMENAIIYQIGIQEKKLDAGQKVQQQTLGWNESEGKTFAQRSKENAHDYRYFPEPDLPPLIVDSDWITAVKTAMPELPNEKRIRYAENYGLQQEDIERLVYDKNVSVFFETCIQVAPKLSPTVIVNWLFTDLYAFLNHHNQLLSETTITPKKFTDLILLVNNGTINQNTGKEVLSEMLSTGNNATEIVTAKGLEQVSDSAQISSLIEKVLSSHPSEVQSYLEGKDTVINWLFGQVMRETKGKANPQVVKRILQESLKNKKN